MKRSARILLATPLLLSACVAEPDIGLAPDARAGPARVLMISVDTLRRDHVGRYSGGADTPTLDALLGAGLTLDNHRGCSNWTYSSVICVFTGRSELELGWVANGSSRAVPEPVPEGTPTLAGWLSDAGFETALVSANSFISDNYRLATGYAYAEVEHDMEAEEVVDRAIDILDGPLSGAVAGESPLLLHVHFLDPHDPYSPPPETLEGMTPPDLPIDVSTLDGIAALQAAASELSPEELQAYIDWIDQLYRAEIRSMDAQIARLLAAVDARSALSGWTVVLWSDHGEQFFDHGKLTHHQSLHVEETSAIASFSGPGIAPCALTLPTTHADIAPTLLGLLGLPIPQGVTGLPAASVPPDRPRFGLFEDGRTTGQAVDLGDERLLYHWSGQLEYYKLGADPSEAIDRYDPSDPGVQALWALLEPQVEALSAIYPDATPSDPGI